MFLLFFNFLKILKKLNWIKDLYSFSCKEILVFELLNLPYSGGKCHPYFNHRVKIDAPYNKRPCSHLGWLSETLESFHLLLQRSENLGTESADRDVEISVESNHCQERVAGGREEAGGEVTEQETESAEVLQDE